jgi:hypothetical protein
VKYAQCVKIWLFLKCVQFLKSCSVSNGHYSESGICSVSDEENGRHMLGTSVLHRRKRETCQQNVRLVS